MSRKTRKPRYQFRGKSIGTNDWVYGGFAHDKELDVLYIISDKHLIMIDPLTFGRKINFGGKSFYHGDIVMATRFSKVSSAVNSLDEICTVYIGVVNQTDANIRISRDIYDCGVMLEDIEPENIKVVGNIFDCKLDIENCQIYERIRPYEFRGQPTKDSRYPSKEIDKDGNIQAVYVYGGYYYDADSDQEYIYLCDDEFVPVEQASAKIDFFFAVGALLDNIYEGDNVKIIYSSTFSTEPLQCIGEIAWSETYGCYGLIDSDGDVGCETANNIVAVLHYDAETSDNLKIPHSTPLPNSDMSKYEEEYEELLRSGLSNTILSPQQLLHLARQDRKTLL